MGSTWSRTRSNTGSRARLRTLAESINRIVKTRRRRRSGGYSIHTSDRKDCQISLALAASLRGSEISSLIKWVLMFGER